MKKSYTCALIGIFLLGSYGTAHAQILKKLEKKLEKRAEKVIDRVLDGETDEKTTTVTEVKSGTGPFKNLSGMVYDFQPGDEIVFFDDFSDEKIGSMASRWTSNGRGITEAVPGFDGQWLRMYNENTYKIKDLVHIPENFTVEFDLLTLADENGRVSIEFGFDHQKGIGKHYYLADRNPVNVEASYQFNRLKFTSNELSQRKSSEVDANMSYFVNAVMKVKLRVVGDRMEAYVNEYKVLDTEMIDPNTKKYFYIAVNDRANQAAMYMNNVRITKL